ncbi:MAG: hypothetical protein SFU98_19530 [Leptospiraceae bacterium]|nr:hypothetical protein [Leptospiraceae bacterium]
MLLKKEFLNKEVLEKIYSGCIVQFSKRQNSKLLVDYTQNLLNAIFKTPTPEFSESKLSYELHYEKIFEIRKLILSDITISYLLEELLKELGLNNTDWNFDSLRLRAITTYGHKLDKAKPAYYIHRDTWYSNPESQINFWIPISPINKNNSFTFYTRYFNEAIQNDSYLFNHKEFNDQGGFQNLKGAIQKTYPRAIGEVQPPKLIPELNSQEILAFSAHHLHGTNHNQTDRTRFSLDFRIFPKEKILNFPLNIDNKSV